MSGLLTYLLALTIALDSSGNARVEIPDSLMGRKICMASRIVEISDPGEAVVGQFSENCVCVRFTRSGEYVQMEQLVPFMYGNPEAGVSRRFRPVSSSSSSVTVDMTDLFLNEYPGLNTYPVTAYNSSGGMVMRTHNPVREKSRIESCFNQEGVQGVVCDMSYRMDGHLYGMFKIEGEFFLRARVKRFFFVPDSSSMAVIPATDKIGAKKLELQGEVIPDRPIYTEEIFCRRNLSEGICYHIDSLMPKAWVEGVRQAVEIFNDAFSKIGLGRPMSCAMAAKDDSVLSDAVLYVPSGMDNFECTMLTDPLDGRIYSSSIVLHSSYINRLCDQYMVQASVADCRARAAVLPSDVVSEIVRTASLQAIGRSLGLTDNLRASFSCTVDDLLDKNHTDVFGVNQTIMEAPVFNYLASREDFDRGVALCQSVLSPYDLMALSTLYGGESVDCKGIKYSPNRDASQRFIPMAVKGDLSSEPIKAAALLASRQAELIGNIDEWFSDENVAKKVAGETRGSYARILVRLTDYLTNEWEEGPSHDQVVEAVISSLRDLQWMNDIEAEQMYRRNVFRQLCQVAFKAEILEKAYSLLRPDEGEWKDMVVTRLVSMSSDDAKAYSILKKIRAKEKDTYINSRIDILL